MGRSKFPGKPAKHVNRKRINVLPPPTSLNAVVGYNNTVTSETDEETKQVNNSSLFTPFDCQTFAYRVRVKRLCFPQVSVHKENDSNVTSVPNTSVTTETRIQRRIPRRKRAAKSIANRPATKKNLVAARTIKNVKNNHSKIPVRKSVRGFATGRTLTTRKQSLVSKESNNLVGKFVLPTRSVHSSRVIKPNKRFINMELSDPRTVKKRVICKRHVIKGDDDKPKNMKIKEGEKESGKNPAEESSSVQAPCSNSRIVLRQARLQLHTQTPSPEGPFSSSSSATTSPPGTVTCGVCGAVRFYRFVKQARKFKIYSCESCRKFISKMIKRQSCAKNMSNVSTLVCHKGQGMCHVPPIVRSQQWKLIRCAYKARCPACWLKMCLRSFHMPMTLKNSLAQLLPKNMQGPELLFNSSLPLLSWQGSVDNKLTEPPIDNPDQQRCTRLKSSAKIAEKPQPTSEIKRQKIDLKGPRVKHVCRSASIVLGQPLATFPADVEKKDVSEAKLETKTQEVKAALESPVENISLASSDSSLDAFVAETSKHLRREKEKYQKQSVASMEVINNFVCH